MPLLLNRAVGIHVAGFHPWADGVPRPTFFHVHNGHGHINFGGALRAAGFIVNGQEFPRIIPTNPSWVWAPRTNFSVHQDFPNPDWPLAQSVHILNQGGYLTRNGDIGHYILIGEALQFAALAVNQIPGVHMPSDPSDVRPRLNFLVTQIQTTAAFYRCSNLSRTIGGKIRDDPDGVRPFHVTFSRALECLRRERLTKFAYREDRCFTSIDHM